MTRLSRKLHSSRGASMLLGLLYLLVCLTVGAVVLTAAATSAGRTERSRREQQNYLAVASAVELVKEDMTGAKYEGQRTDTHTITTTHHYEGEGEDEKYTGSSSSNSGYPHSITGSVTQSELLSCADSDLNAFFFDTGAPSSASFVYELSFAPDHEALPPVKGTLTLSVDGSGSCSALVALHVDDAAHSNPVRIKFSFYAKPQEGTPSSVKVSETKYQTVEFVTKLTTASFTLTSPTIEKGGGAS